MSNSTDILTRLNILRDKSTEIADTVGRSISPENQSNLDDELAELVGSNYGSNDGSISNNNPTVQIQNTGPMNKLNILKKNNTKCFLCEKTTNNLTLNNNGFTLCANCKKEHKKNLEGGSKNKLTFKQQKQLKKIILLYNKIKTKILNNK
jgi:hypothetical protein